VTTDVDAVIAGGGVAGSAAAAALAALGWSVLIVEPGQHGERRLAGELIHPSGVRRLAELGLLGAPAFAAAARLDGFAIFPEAGVQGCIDLPYARPGEAPAVALALDHASICGSLLATVAALPSVTLAQGWRVTSLEGTPGNPIVRIRRAGVTEAIGCRLVIAADGASSPVRTYAGLGHRRVRNAVLTGYLVEQDVLPLPGRGHIFTASGGPVLAYAIGGSRGRVLFNGPLVNGPPVNRPLINGSPVKGPLVNGPPVNGPLVRGSAAHSDALRGIEALTPRLRAAVEAAMAAGTGQRFVSGDVTVSGVTRGHVVLVGDAAGTCHPISASGMTMGIDDATRLARALRCRDGDVPSALAVYASERRSRQCARVLLAAMLHDALGGAGPEMGLLRSALHRYWSGSARARAASMALLGMDDVSMRSILAEFLRVMAAACLASCGEPVSMLRRAGLMARLSRPMMRHVVGAIRVQ
jgi:2-polyprenyl-6-methoxyphenol hydroxylase-like FAD-dependent oxidoreductase